MGTAEPGQHGGPGGRIVDEPCLDGSSLHDVAHLNSIVKVHVGMMCAAAILKWVLHEAEAVEADPGEACGVSTARLSCGCGSGPRDCLELEVTNRSGPLFEDGSNLVVAVGRDAAKASAARVVVEVSVEFCVLGCLLHGVAWREVLLNIEFGAE